MLRHASRLGAGRPARRHRALRLESMHRRIHRAFLDRQGVIGCRLDSTGDRVAVERAVSEGLEQQEFKGAAKELL